MGTHDFQSTHILRNVTHNRSGCGLVSKTLGGPGCASILRESVCYGLGARHPQMSIQAVRVSWC